MRYALACPLVVALIACGDDELSSVMDDSGVASQDASGPILDSGAALDAQPLIDLGFIDASSPADGGVNADSGVGGPDVGFADAGFVTPCPYATLGAADRDRVVLVAHPIASSGGGLTDLRSMSLSAGGVLADDGIRMDVGVEVADIEFVPSGELALLAGNALMPMDPDQLVSVSVDGAGSVNIVDRVMLPPADAREVHLSEDARTAYVVSLNVAETSGIHVVDVACDGSLTLLDSEFLNVVLADNLALLPGSGEAILLGGQAMFTMPPDTDDLRWLAPSGRGFQQVALFDIWGDPSTELYASVDAYRIGLSPDAKTLLIPNGSAFSAEGNQLAVIAVDTVNRTLTEVDRITMGFDDAREALFSPDGQTALVTLFQPNRVKILTNPGGGWQIVGEITGIGLAEAMAQVERGSLAGRVLLTSTDVSGDTNVAQLQITGTGMVSDLGQLNFAGGGTENIPGAIGITP